LEKLTSGTNSLKASRLHGDVDDEVCEMFTQRVAEIATLKRLVGVLEETDEHEKINEDGKRVKRDKAEIEEM
jgi:hypothetical protein